MDEPRIYTRRQMIVVKRIAEAKGREDMEEFLQERIVNVKNIITDCIEEIFRLDTKYPITGVLLPQKFAESLVNKLKKDHHSRYAARLQEYMDKSNPIDLEKEEVMLLIEEMTNV